MSKLDVFSTFQPLDLKLIKSEDGGKVYKISGIATTEHTDTAGEIILQNGIDWSYCLKSGSFNYDHSNLPAHILGAPQSVEKVKHNGKSATKISGILYGDKQIVKDLVENVKLMRSTKSGRSLGFSIEGQVMERDRKNPKIITRAKVLNVSLTHQPANQEATVQLVKNILKSMENKTEMNKSDEYQDKPMSLRQSKLICDYAEKMVSLLEGKPDDVDLPEWVQSKINTCKEYMQASYHYLEEEMKKDVNPDYLDSLEEESVVSPEDVKVPDLDRDNDYPQKFEMEKAYKYSKEDMDKMDRKEIYEYVRFLEGLKKEQCETHKKEDCEECMDKFSDLSAIQPESLEDDIADEGPKMNMGEDDSDEKEKVIELEGLTMEELKELLKEMFKLNLPVEMIKEYIRRYSHK